MTIPAAPAQRRPAHRFYRGDPLVKEMARCKASFLYFLRKMVYIADRSPDGALAGVRKWEWWPIHDQICADLQNENRLCILKARQIGLSWILAALHLWSAMFQDNYLGGVTSINERQSIGLLDKCRFIYDHLPWETKPTVKTSNNTEFRFSISNGAIVAYPSTINAGRGDYFSRFTPDEAAFHPYAAENYESYAIATEYGQIIIVSSAGSDEAAQVLNPWFQQFWLAARDGENGFAARFYPYGVRPGRDDAWYERESRRLSGRPGAMQREFPRTPEEAFRSMMLLRFDVDAIDEGLAYARSIQPLAAVSNLPEGLKEPASKGYLRLWSTPRPGLPYVLGIDGAEGKGLDFTVTHVYEARTLRHVATLRENVLEPAEHGQYAAALAKWFNNAWCMVERSHGEAILIQLSLAQCRVYKVYPEGRMISPSGKPALGTPGMPVTAQTRPGLIDDLAEAIKDRALSSPDLVLWQENAVFIVMPNGRPEAAGGQHDDSTMASALAVRMARQPGATELLSTTTASAGPKGYTWAGGQGNERKGERRRW